MKKLLFVFILLIIQFSVNIHQGLSQWQKISIAEGANVNAMTKDSSGYIFAITSNNQVYRSSDNGILWENFTNGINKTLQCVFSTPTSVLLGTFGSGIYRSTNHGQNWTLIEINSSGNYVYSFCNNGNYIFTGTQNGVYKSVNDGVTWILSNSGIGFTHGIQAMISTANYLFAESSIGSTGTMYKSTDNGDNWIVSNNGLPTFYMSSLAKCGNIVFVASWTSRVYQTFDYGLNWSITPGLPSGSSPQSISAERNIVIASYYQQTYISTNCGSPFISSSAGLPAVSVNSCLIINNGIFAATAKGIFKTTNSGVNWFGANSGFNNVDFPAVLGINNFVFAGSNGFGVYKSTNYGISWNLINPFGVNSSCSKIFLDSNKIYINGTFGFRKSIDYGTNWTLISPPGFPATSMHSFFVKDSLIFGGFDDAGIYKTSNFGTSWIQCNTGLPDYMLEINSIIIKDNIVLTILKDWSFQSIIFKTTNFGSKWDSLSNTGLPHFVNLLALNQNTLYAGSSGYGIYLSTNDGNNWIQKNNGLPNNLIINSIDFKNGVIYIGTGSGIYKSTNNAENWQIYNEGITNNEIYSISSGTSTLYAGGSGSFYIRTLLVGAENNNKNNPEKYYLYQNYPNPFNPTTKIKFDIGVFPLRREVGGMISLKIFDITGREIQTLVNEKLNPGTYEVTFDGSNYASGVFFYQLRSGDFIETKKLILLK